MDNQYDLKKKLELLGEPALPDGLSAEELFRRMDAGELTLPDDPVPKETVSEGRVIPWAKVLRRGLPIAACLALVVLLSQGGLWKMASSGGANFTANAAAPQSKEAAADRAAVDTNGSEEVPAEIYSFDDADEDVPEPRAIITMEDDAEAEEAAEDDAVSEELYRQGAENSVNQSVEVDDIAADSADSASDEEKKRPSTGGKPGNESVAPPTDGGDQPTKGENPPTGGGNPPTGGSGEEHPDTGGPSGDGDDQWNPDTGGGGDDVNPDSGGIENDKAQFLKLLIELVDDVFEREASLSGLTPEFRGLSMWPSEGKGGPIKLEAVFFGMDDENKEVYIVRVRSTATWSEKEGRYFLRLDGLEIIPAPSPGGAGDAVENPDTTGSSEGDPDNDPVYSENPDIDGKTGPNGDESPELGTDDQGDDREKGEKQDQEENQEQVEKDKESLEEGKEEEAQGEELTEAPPEGEEQG